MRLMRLMRPMRLIGLIGLMSLVACSSDNAPGEDTPTPLTPTETAISFNSGLNDGADISRSEGFETTGVDSFKVWAYKNMSYENGSYGDLQTVIPGYTVNYVANSANSSTSNTNNWEYVGQGADQTIKYWDWSAKAYRFFGVAETPTGPNKANTANGANEPNGPYEVKVTLTVDASSDDGIAATPYYSHLWFSTGNTANYPNKQFGKPVQLEFLKPVAQVRFMFTFVPELLELGTDRTKLSEISFKPTADTDETELIANQGTVTITYPLTRAETEETWESTATATGYFDAFVIDYYDENTTYTPKDALPTSYPNSPEHFYNVLPVKSQGSYTLSAVVVGGKPKTCVVPAEYMSWEPGYQYTYIFKITESGGIKLDEIQVGINDWVVKERIEHPVYNW